MLPASNRTEATPTGALIFDVIYGLMPDGSPIRPSVKVDAILASLGVIDLPEELKTLISQGIASRLRRKQGRGR